MFSESHIHVLTNILSLIFPLVTAFYIRHDYRAFLSLGPGGTPSTPLGYLKLKLLSFVCLRDPLRPMPVPPHFRPQKGYFDNDALPRRRGARPVVVGIAPQRQQTQKAGKEMYAQLVAKIKKTASNPRNQLTERISYLEKHSFGLFTTTPLTRVAEGEICHAHEIDGSMHMQLHPADAKLMLENGWGERHPLARGGWCRRFVPKEFVLIYAPRDRREVDIIMKLVAASVWWVSGIDVNGDREAPRKGSADGEAVGKIMEGTNCWACKTHKDGETKVNTMICGA